MKADDSVDLWLPIIGRALANIVVRSSDVRDRSMAEKAQVLERLGLPRKETAALLDTSEGSIRGLLRYAGKSKTARTRGNKSSKRSEPT